MLFRSNASALVDEHTIVIIEASADTDAGFAEELGFSVYREKKYGSNKHIFLEKRKA